MTGVDLGRHRSSGSFHSRLLLPLSLQMFSAALPMRMLLQVEGQYSGDWGQNGTGVYFKLFPVSSPPDWSSTHRHTHAPHLKTLGHKERLLGYQTLSLFSGYLHHLHQLAMSTAEWRARPIPNSTSPCKCDWFEIQPVDATRSTPTSTQWPRSCYLDRPSRHTPCQYDSKSTPFGIKTTRTTDCSCRLLYWLASSSQQAQLKEVRELEQLFVNQRRPMDWPFVDSQMQAEYTTT